MSSFAVLVYQIGEVPEEPPVGIVRKTVLHGLAGGDDFPARCSCRGNRLGNPAAVDKEGHITAAAGYGRCPPENRKCVVSMGEHCHTGTGCNIQINTGHGFSVSGDTHHPPNIDLPLFVFQKTTGAIGPNPGPLRLHLSLNGIIRISFREIKIVHIILIPPFHGHGMSNERIRDQIPFILNTEGVGDGSHTLDYFPGDPMSARSFQDPGLMRIRNDIGIVIGTVDSHSGKARSELSILFHKTCNDVQSLPGGSATFQSQPEKVHPCGARLNAAFFVNLYFPGQLSGEDAFVPDGHTEFIDAFFISPAPVGAGTQGGIGLFDLWYTDPSQIDFSILFPFLSGMKQQGLTVKECAVAVFR